MVEKSWFGNFKKSNGAGPTLALTWTDAAIGSQVDGVASERMVSDSGRAAPAPARRVRGEGGAGAGGGG